MKRTTNKRKASHGEKRKEIRESSHETNCSYMTTTTLACENVRYHLRSRKIFYSKKQEAPPVVKNISILKKSALLKENDTTQTNFSFGNSPTEDIAGKTSSKADTFTQQQQASNNITHSMNDKFTSEPSIMMLPNEVLLMIFSYLNVHELSTSVAPVCKRWHLIAHNPILWRKLYFDGDRVPTEFAKNLLTKSPHLSELVISDR